MKSFCGQSQRALKINWKLESELETRNFVESFSESLGSLIHVCLTDGYKQGMTSQVKSIPNKALATGPYIP